MLLAGFWLSDLFISPIFYLTFSLCFDHFVYFFAIISLNIQYFSCYTIIYKNVWSDLISPTPINWSISLDLSNTWTGNGGTIPRHRVHATVPHTAIMTPGKSMKNVGLWQNKKISCCKGTMQCSASLNYVQQYYISKGMQQVNDPERHSRSSEMALYDRLHIIPISGL